MKGRIQVLKPEVLSAFVLTPWAGDGKAWGEKWYCPECDVFLNMEGEELQRQRAYNQWFGWVNAKKRVRDKKARAELGRMIQELLGQDPGAATPPRPRECAFCKIVMVNAGEALGRMFAARDHPDAGPHRPVVADYLSNGRRGCGYYEDVTGQYVHLLEFSPNPNCFMCKVAETGTQENPAKHEGQIKEVRADVRFLVVREWIEDAATKEEKELLDRADAMAVRLYLLEQGFDSWLVDYTLQRGLDEGALRMMLRAREKPAVHITDTVQGMIQLPKGVEVPRPQPVMGPRNVITWRTSAEMAAGVAA